MQNQRPWVRSPVALPEFFLFLHPNVTAFFLSTGVLGMDNPVRISLFMCMYCTLLSLHAVFVCIVHCHNYLQHVYIFYIVIIMYSICVHCRGVHLEKDHEINWVKYETGNHDNCRIHINRLFLYHSSAS